MKKVFAVGIVPIDLNKPNYEAYMQFRKDFTCEDKAGEYMIELEKLEAPDFSNISVMKDIAVV